MDKSSLLDTLRAELESQFRRITGAAGEARGYATDPDSKAENKYDTRTVEAAYLAAGQAAKAEELAAVLQTFATWSPPAFPPDAAIALGALVETAGEGDQGAAFLLAPTGGGLETALDGIPVTVISPQAPLFQRLQGARAGDRVGSLRILVVT